MHVTHDALGDAREADLEWSRRVARAAALCARESRRGTVDVVVECLNKLPFLSPLYARVPVLALCHHLFGEVAFQQVAWPIAVQACKVLDQCFFRVPAQWLAVLEGL